MWRSRVAAHFRRPLSKRRLKSSSCSSSSSLVARLPSGGLLCLRAWPPPKPERNGELIWRLGSGNIPSGDSPSQRSSCARDEEEEGEEEDEDENETIRTGRGGPRVLISQTEADAEQEAEVEAEQEAEAEVEVEQEADLGWRREGGSVIALDVWPRRECASARRPTTGGTNGPERC